MTDNDPIALDVTVPNLPGGPTRAVPAGRSDIYEVEGVIGQGGGGIVMKARDRRLDRSVAIKVLPGPHELLRVRFEREMRITAKLQHPGVVPVHDTGVWENGLPFYAMRLIEGRSLKQVVADCRTLAERLQLLPNLLAVAETVAYAHSQAIIHRDLKPSNIIVGPYGETVVIDWGLVKDLAASVDDEPPVAGLPEGEGVTVSGQVIGTPAYMPPEQARGGGVDRRADVYALGALLRELITGRAPYEGADWRDVLERVLVGDLPDAASFAREAPRDLIAVADKAMARDPEARYSDAAAFVVDLKRYLQGGQVGAYAYAPRERLRKWAARSRGVVVTATIAAGILVTMGALSLSRILRERDDAIASRRDAVDKSNALLREQAARELDQGNALRAYQLLQSYPEDATDWAQVYPLVNRIGLAGLPDFWARPGVEVGYTSRMAIDASGRFVALADTARLEVWNLVTKKRELGVELAGGAASGIVGVEALTIGTHAYFAVAREDGELVVVDHESSTSRHSYHPCGDAGVEDMSSLAHEPSIAIACDDGAIVRFDIARGVASPVTQHRGQATGVAFEAPDVIVSAGVDGLVRSRAGGASTSLVAGRRMSMVRTQPACHATIAGTQDGRIVVTSESAQVTPFEEVVDSGGSVVAAGIDDHCRLAFGLSDVGNLVVVDLATHKVLTTGKAMTVAFYPGPTLIAIGVVGILTVAAYEAYVLWRRRHPRHLGA